MKSSIARWADSGSLSAEFQQNHPGLIADHQKLVLQDGASGQVASKPLDTWRQSTSSSHFAYGRVEAEASRRGYDTRPAGTIHDLLASQAHYE